MPSSPNRGSAIGNQVLGGAMEAAGTLKNAVTGNDDLKKQGIERKEEGQQSYDAAQAADKADAKKDEASGNVKEAIGGVGNAIGIKNDLEGEGKAEQAKADVKDAKSQI